MTRTLAGKMPLIYHEYQFATDREAYQVSVLEFVGNVSQETWDTVYLGRLITSYARGSGSTLRSQNSTIIGGRTGLEAATEDPTHDRYHLIDVFAAGGRVYLLASEGPKGHEASADAKRFLDSFKLVGQ